jgi:hypothetical protein
MISMWFGKGWRKFHYELKIKFATHGVMDVIGFVYP